jgi:predicted ATPase/tetratricopeptide (TPR) repeat protein
MSIIKTPDQRLRVFISSTINELTQERQSAKAVIESLKLTPVYFEAGARPHPARDLYRSYLDQSDIFIGIYWKSYGWIAPDMEISGLEDEWQLSGNKPKLIYIKNSTERDAKLKALLSEIENNGAICYQNFNSADDLANLLANDIAILLSERFQTAIATKEINESAPKNNLPTVRNEIIGREKEINELIEKLDKSEAGLITLTGPGGTGKTRLSLEVGKRILNKFNDGVYFVSLASITETERVPWVIAQALGMNNSGVKDVAKWLLEYLFDKSLLLILDNFEQIANAGIFVSQILNKCPKVKIIVTSRTPLYLRYENIFPVEPLGVKPYMPNAADGPSEAVQLFMQRAKDSNTSINWDEENLAAAYSICNKVDGLPLAIELSAARCRHLNPIQLEKKLSTVLNSNLTGPVDYPERQKTLRNTIQWSYNLLDKTDQRLFHRLPIFVNGWSYDAMEKVCWEEFKETENLDISLERLIDYGLVVKTASNYNCYRLLQIIKEYAYEKMVESEEEKSLKDFHCSYFQTLAIINSQKTWAGIADVSHLNFREDYENILEAFQYALEIKDVIKILSLINYLNALYMMTGEIGYLFELIEKATIKSDATSLEEMVKIIPGELLAFSFLSVGFTRSTTGNFNEGLRDLMAARQFAKKVNMPQIEGFALLFMGLANVTMGNFENAKELLLESIQLTRLVNQLPGQLTAEVTLHIVYLEENNVEKATTLLDNAIILSQTSFMPLVQSYALYERGFLHYYLKEYEAALQRFKESDELNKKFNLNLNGSFPLIGFAMVHTELNNFDQAINYFKKSLDCIRTSGNTIEFECFKYAFCNYLAKAGQSDKAIRLYSFIKKQKSITNFQPWISQRCCLDYAYETLNTVYDAAVIKNNIENAVDLSREEIYAMI